ncbi:hypothetical protein ADP71_17470 [Vitreoscilla sp. C1]|uniref:hypothetical protein n=1 Tax=Vitreoscilla sp. (strain C1) TaxID=96942 RepID=UPI000CDC273D|nr:hypothetical protein [Vitreoscilla sp. C1]AUZ05274.1 hypothetical protein ADP71_17470 [Vitreoscilla sp. C1]
MAQNTYQRQLVGQQSGVQVNIPYDRTERLLQETGDQTFATVGVFTRGRIDKPMLVAASKMKRYLGEPQSLRKTQTASTYLQMVEAFSRGAAAAVVMRLASDAASNQWILLSHAEESQISLVEEVPISGTWFMAVKLADCINAGVWVSFEKGKNNTEISLVVRERKTNSRGVEVGTGDVLYTVTGSTDVDATDDLNQSYFIADVAQRYYGDWLSIEVNHDAHAILPDDALFAAKQAKAVVPYTDAGVLADIQYVAAANQIGNTSLQYRYIMSDTNHVALVFALTQVAIAQNRRMYQAIDGMLSPEAAIAWKDQFEIDDQEAMYVGWLWSPLERQDPTYKNGIVLMSSVGQKVGLACARNATYNAYGMPALQQPIAGRDYQLIGTKFNQTQYPNDLELAQLAEAKINPCLYQEYHDTSGYVWADSLSGANKSGISKLESAAEIAIWFQHYFGRYAKSVLQKPMTDAIRAMEDQLQRVCEWAQASDWLVPSASLDGAAFGYVVRPNERYPDDEMDVTINLAINGVVRRIFIDTNMYSID